MKIMITDIKGAQMKQKIDTEDRTLELSQRVYKIKKTTIKEVGEKRQNQKTNKEDQIPK